MHTHQPAPKTIDAYIATFPHDVQAILEKIRTMIREAVPDAEETISYHMPTFKLKGTYVAYFAAYKKHIGLYAAPIDNPAFKADLSAYASGKGTVKFPLDQPIPFDVITKIVRFRVKEIEEAAR